MDMLLYWLPHTLIAKWDVRECLTGGCLHAVSHKSSVSCQFLATETSGVHATPRTEGIGWDRLESPSVNILLTTKLLSLDPLSWDMGCLLTLWPLLIPCSLGNGCCSLAESEELKSCLMKVKEESEKVGLKLNIKKIKIKKMKIMASNHFMANRWGNSGNSDILYFGGLQNHWRWWLQPWN